MKDTFSPELIARIIKYFKEEYNHDISEETAELYLSSLADLFEVFSDISRKDQP